MSTEAANDVTAAVSGPARGEPAPDVVAAVDLGSNSVHLLVARLHHGHLVPVERVKEKVQLARGQRDGRLDPAAVERGLAAVARFAQRLRGIPADRICVAGTSALREATNPDAFVPAASALLRKPVRILSGREEAELVFLGVSHALAAEAGAWLVVDIGGGSTEFCCGRAFTPDRAVSVRLGCVGLTEPWFREGGIPPAEYAAVRARASALLADVPAALGSVRGARAIGTSGTVESIQSVLNANGFAKGPITRSALAELERAMVERRWIDYSGIPGLAPERVDIFPAGVAALAAVCETLGLDEVEFVEATLLDGLIHDLLGRRSAEDVRELAVAHWRTRFDVDGAQVARVKKTALTLLDGVGGAWHVDDERSTELLRWACDLHEIGLSVSARQPNRHGAYMIENGDLAGFIAGDRRALALLVRAHRGGFPAFAFAPFDADAAQALRALAVALRLAVILERSRTDADSPQVSAHAPGARRVTLEVDGDWLDAHPLSAFELDAEVRRLATAGMSLSISRR
jgi:exopolyphosphatase/guanosine-5'-triphosphate,3'-diphosphate pyrophosphatase